MMKNLHSLTRRVPKLATPFFGFRTSVSLANKKLSTGEASVVLANKIKGITQQVINKTYLYSNTKFNDLISFRKY